MKKMLVTGGTVFVSRYAAEYFAHREWEVYVLNRNTRPQSDIVTLIEADRKQLGGRLKDMYFDAVLDITTYNAGDVDSLLNGLGGFGDYILLSSSAVYPESTPQPFSEDAETGENSIWGKYGTDKIAAEEALLRKVPEAYILRPPYLYGPGNNVYREAFVFECALDDRPFYIPRDGEMRLQFFHVDDLCRFMDLLLKRHPAQHIFNVGNRHSISIREWVELCYRAVGKAPRMLFVHEDIPQRSYFSFYDYEYALDVELQNKLMPDTVPLERGLRESFEWYLEHKDLVARKNLIEFIDNEIANKA